MELASIYVESTDFKDDRTFTLDFSSEDNFQNVYFNKYSDYYIATMDCQLDLSDIWTKTDHFSNLTLDKLVDKLSDLSRELLTKRADYQNDIKIISLKSTLKDNLKYDFDLELSDTIIDFMSFKYSFYDTVEKKQKMCKIYNPFKHLTAGLKFIEKTPKNANYPMTFTVKLSDDRKSIIKTLDFDRKSFDFDSYYSTKNTIFLYRLISEQYINSGSSYQVIYNATAQFNDNVPSIQKLIEDFYYLYTSTKHVITTEEDWNKMSNSQKNLVAIIVGKNNRWIAPQTIYVAPSDFRGSAAKSILQHDKFVKKVTLSIGQIKTIKENIPNFPLTELQEYSFDF